MKKNLLSTWLLLLAPTLFAQNITGAWNGLLKVSGIQLRLVFHIEKSETGFTATMDSPDQKALDIPVTSVTFEDPNLHIVIKNAGIDYSGVLESGMVKGVFKQGGQAFPMDLSREAIEIVKPRRSQEPQSPFPYKQEDIVFKNEADQIQLAGTLTLPDHGGKFPAVVLISGSGPQNRNEELMGHKPFLVLSDYLTRQGIAVLRYDDRGTAQSKGSFGTSTSADFSKDAEAAFQYLQGRSEIDPTRIGFIGHSEGGIIAPMVAARRPEVAFIALLAGTGIPGDQLLLLQQELIAKASGVNAADIEKMIAFNRQTMRLVAEVPQPDSLKKALTTYIQQCFAQKGTIDLPENMSEAQFTQLNVRQLTSPWMRFFIPYDPAPTLERVHCPVLALNGEKDLQVPPQVNLVAIQKALEKAGNSAVTIRQFQGLNHLFQECTTGDPAEYESIEQTMAPIVMDTLATWILALGK